MHEEMALYLTLAWFTKLASGSRPGCIIVSVSVSKQTEASVQRVTQHWYMHGTVVVRVPVYAQIRTNSCLQDFQKDRMPARCYHGPLAYCTVHTHTSRR
jgi:hypothetical protein